LDAVFDLIDETAVSDVEPLEVLLRILASSPRLGMFPNGFSALLLNAKLGEVVDRLEGGRLGTELFKGPGPISPLEFLLEGTGNGGSVATSVEPAVLVVAGGDKDGNVLEGAGVPFSSGNGGRSGMAEADCAFVEIRVGA
jgi:hypothetical protein